MVIAVTMGLANNAECYYDGGDCWTKVMITTGDPTSSAKKTEVVDVESGETCADLADFPVKIYGAVSADIDGTPVVCGGSYSGYSRKCYRFKNGKWKKFASMKEKRGFAAGIMHKNKFHVFGGASTSGLSKTTELISIDGGVEDGPELPEAVHVHAITSINSTVSLLSGGCTSATCSSPLTWYFNHETNVFSPGPSLLEGRRYHGSATIVDKVTKAKIPMVTGGVGNDLDSTELLINGQWQSGPTLPKALYGHSIVEIQGDAFLFGGYLGGGKYNSANYQLTCSSGTCSWSTNNQELKVARYYTVAIPVPDSFCT